MLARGSAVDPGSQPQPPHSDRMMAMRAVEMPAGPVWPAVVDPNRRRAIACGEVDGRPGATSISRVSPGAMPASTWMPPPYAMLTCSIGPSEAFVIVPVRWSPASARSVSMRGVCTAVWAWNARIAPGATWRSRMRAGSPSSTSSVWPLPDCWS